MAQFDKGDKILFKDFDNHEKYEHFLLKSPSGILCVPDASFDGTIASECYSFAKWVKRTSPEIQIDVVEGKGVRDLRSADYWLPLVYLASDVSVQIYLNIAANYIYDMARGALRHDKTTVHLAAVYKDGETGAIKRFSYDGSQTGLKDIIKKFDLNKFLDD